MDILCYREVWEKYKYNAILGRVIVVNGVVRFDEYTKKLSLVANNIKDGVNFLVDNGESVYIKIGDFKDFNFISQKCVPSAGAGIPVIFCRQANGVCGLIKTKCTILSFDKIEELASFYSVNVH